MLKTSLAQTLKLLTLLIFTSSCSYFHGERVPAQGQSEFINTNLLESTQNVLDELSVKSLDISVCTNQIASEFSFLSQVPSDHFYTNYSWEEFQTIINGLWNIKQNLRRHVQNWSEQGVMTRECSFAIRAAYRATRFFEDNVSMFYLNTRGHMVTGFETDDESPNFSAKYPWTKSDDEQFEFKRDLQSGDLLLWRGKSAISASIARLGDSETNFSHLSIVYRDPENGKLYNIESLIETGLIVKEFTKKALHPGSPRVVVLRHRDRELAARAGKFAYDISSKTMNTDNHLYYDFGFDLEDHKTVFCSEIVNWAFSEASKGSVKIPAFNTHFDMKNRSFLNAIGTDAYVGFQPGDIELTPDFDMIAEWRNLKFSKANQIKDVIHSNFYRWMDNYNYNFKWSFKGNIFGSLAYGLRRTPLISGLIEEKFPLNMPRKTLSSVLTMEKVSNIVYDELKDKLFKKNPNAIYSLADLENAVEEIRLEDLQRFKDQIEANRSGDAYSNPKFHHLFGPKKKEVR